MKEQYIRALLTLTKVRSEPKLNALIDHMCFGLKQKEAADKHGIAQESLARLKAKVKKLDRQVTTIISLKQ